MVKVALSIQLQPHRIVPQGYWSSQLMKRVNPTRAALQDGNLQRRISMLK
jgi:hypothetical protein